MYSHAVNKIPHQKTYWIRIILMSRHKHICGFSSSSCVAIFLVVTRARIRKNKTMDGSDACQDVALVPLIRVLSFSWLVAFSSSLFSGGTKV